jgi:hypothetical protein
MLKLSALRDFGRGLKMAFRDDRNIGANDVPALRALARRTGVPGLTRLVDLFALAPALKRYVPPPARGHFISEVLEFKPGPGGGYNQNRLHVVFGAPELITDRSSGSTNVVSLGRGGSITVKLEKPVSAGIVVYENAFEVDGKIANPSPARVEVSADGKTWYALRGMAGMKVEGDRFRFSENALPANFQALYVRITDASGEGSASAATGGVDGFDLNAVRGYN